MEMNAPRPWHALQVGAAFTAFATDYSGLADPDAKRRLDHDGPNELPAPVRRSWLARFFGQFDNLLIYVLLGSAAITGVLGHGVDTAVILGVVVVNAMVGFLQEGRAERALDAIRTMLAPSASVIRDGQRVTVAARDIVPGDIVLLEPGDRVAADLRIFQARNLQIQEAVLTGESEPVTKATASVAIGAPLADRTCMAFSGTLVTVGRGRGVVVATGAGTEFGRIGALLGSVETLITPLLRQMNRFARWLTGLILGIACIVFAFAVLVRDYPSSEAFMIMVAMSVAAIPEGLPAVLTITLAIGVQRMAVRNAVIRRLPAVETLGAVSIICSDKTGTLTRNEMTVRTLVTTDHVYEVTGAGYTPRGAFRRDGADVDPVSEPVLRNLCHAALLCNDAGLIHDAHGWSIEGDPMEGALVVLAAKAGFDVAVVRKQFPRSDEIPFDAMHRFMATLHHGHGGDAFLCVKGAPEHIFAMCAREAARDGTRSMDRDAWEKRVAELAAGGQRVLAVATGDVPAGHRDLTFGDVAQGLTLVGLLGLIDPPREEAIEALQECRAAGIRVKMITGDHADTARAIAKQVGMDSSGMVLTDRDLDQLDDAAFSKAVQHAHVFARISPGNKLRLVQAFQASGAVVAMTGDGVNDAPALKRADVGIAMGLKGTEAAKEAAEMVLLDDNFASIVAAVREGRTVYDNLKKVISWTLPTNGGEALSLITAVFLGTGLPLTAVQILWINMVTAVALGLTLAFEPTEAGTMTRRPRRPDESLLSGFLMWRVVFVSVLFVGGVFSVFAWGRSSHVPLEQVHTLVVNAIVAMEVAYLFSVRYLYAPALSLDSIRVTRAVLIGVGSVVIFQLLFTYLPPMWRLFGSHPLSAMDWGIVIGLGALLFGVLELEKAVWPKGNGRPHRANSENDVDTQSSVH
jgi:magnesium-transporting ATPase (P-type)